MLIIDLLLILRIVGTDRRIEVYLILVSEFFYFYLLCSLQKSFVAETAKQGSDAAPWDQGAPRGGDVPNLHVFSKHQLDDGQRQYNWEQGRSVASSRQCLVLHFYASFN